MTLIHIGPEVWEDLMRLHTAYKAEIGEDAPASEAMDALAAAMQRGAIRFYGCVEDSQLVGCCSISETFSTFNYQRAGVFEDFFILPTYRHRGIARQLVRYAVQESGVQSLTVGCADCDVDMYKALGFSIPLGHMLAYEIG